MRKKYLKTNWVISSPIVKTLVYANVFISFCSFAQVLLVYHLFSIPFDFNNTSYLFFVLLSTYLQYNVQRGYMVNENNIYTDRSQWLLKHKKVLLYSVGISLVIVLFLCNNLSWTSIGIMIAAEVISTLYYLPPVNLRKHGYIKPFLVSLIWVISCSLVPLIENHLITSQSIWFVFSQFCFISILCLLFDIKDAESDYLLGVNTYANKFGIVATKAICFALLVLSILSFYAFKQDIQFLLTSVVMGTIVVFTVLLTNDKRHPFYYYLWVDGILILQALCFYLI